MTGILTTPVWQGLHSEIASTKALGKPDSRLQNIKQRLRQPILNGPDDNPQQPQCQAGQDEHVDESEGLGLVGRCNAR